MEPDYIHFLKELGDSDQAEQILAELAGYTKTPPTINEFIDDEYYLGRLLGNKLYKTWRDVLNEIYPSPYHSDYLEIILTGSTAAGKTTTACVGLLYDLCRLLYLKSPHDRYGLLSTDELVISCINTTMTLSEAVLFNKLMAFINGSPFFLEQKAKSEKQYLLPHKLNIMQGSMGIHSVGRAVVGSVLSELNHKGHRLDQAVGNYVETKNRMKGRFFRGEGYEMPGRLWLDSSRTNEAAWLESHMKDVASDPDVLIVSKPQWVIASDAGKVHLSGKTFKVFVGDEKADPFIMLDGAELPSNLSSSLIWNIPVEYEPEFRTNLRLALRDIAGIAVWSAGRFVPETDLVRSALIVTNPTRKQTIQLDLYDDKDQLTDYIDISKLDKHSHYYLHLDASLTKDATGIALTRIVAEKPVERWTAERLLFTSRDFIYETSLLLHIKAKPGQQIPLPRISEFVEALGRLGVRLGGVSADGYQSAEFLQRVEAMGIKSERISVDKPRDAYDQWRNAFLEGRWSAPSHPVLEREILELVDNGEKIDHPPEASTDKAERPSKDLIDACVGSFWNCKENSGSMRAVNALKEYHQAMHKSQEVIGIREDLKKFAQQHKSKKSW